MPHTHPISYRETEVGDVYRRILAGDSCAVVGVSGAGKTNFAAHLASRAVREARLSAPGRWLFASLSSNAIIAQDARAPYEAVLAAILRDAQAQAIDVEMTNTLGQ